MPKPATNAFFFFMMDFKNKEESRGREFIDMKEVSAAAGVEWEKMSASQREPYDRKKQQSKNGKKVKKYTSFGEDLDLVEKRKQEAIRNKKRMTDQIEELVEDDDYVNKTFFVAEVNHYCFCSSINKHIPAEISIVRFNLKDGICLEDCFHVILDTGELPIGFRLAALTTSKSNHEIPIPPHDESMEKFSEKNIQKVYQSMVEFLRKNLEPKDHLPPVYVDYKEDDDNMAKAVFTDLYNQFGGNNPYNAITVYSLSYLFFVLRNARSKVFPYPTIPQAELEKDIYDYVKGIACEFHNGSDAYPYCTLSKCIRKIFIICDHICEDLGIQVIPGRHVPKNARAEKLQLRSSSQASWTSVNNPSRPSSSLSNGASGPQLNDVNRFAQLKLEEKGGEPDVSSGRVASSSLAYNTVASSRSNADSLRKPQSVSMARCFKPVQPPDMSDFPALGSPTQRQTAGRGRGRILQTRPTN